MDSNSKKSQFLGMPFGTASARLRKMILFSLLKKHNENTCFRCQKIIETIEELSIEHKLPWEGRSIELFWDLNNIAFSHLKCNKPHIKNASRGPRYDKRKIGPEGTSWCCGCQEFKPIIEFSKNRTKWRGLNHECKLCVKVRYTRNRRRDELS